MTDLPTATDCARHWVFACVADALAEDGSHVTIDLPALSLTVQNVHGTLAAFWNVCSHRAVQIRPAGRGRGPLRCPYHGWSYNGAGVPVGIPDNALFYGLDRAARESLALRPAAIATCGSLVFLRGNRDGDSLAATLGGEAARLAGLSLSDHWTVAARARLLTTAPVPELSVVTESGWSLIVQTVATGSGGVASALLLHPDLPPADHAPPALRAAFEAVP